MEKRILADCMRTVQIGPDLRLEERRPSFLNIKIGLTSFVQSYGTSYRTILLDREEFR